MRRLIVRSGFTLIELLVVIAIIAVLAAILFPVFNSAKDHARQVKCCNNLKQLATAVLLYTDSWDSRFPGARVCGESSTFYGTPPYNNWCGSMGVGYMVYPNKGQLANYVKNTDIFLCPSDVKREAKGMGSCTLDQRLNCPLSYSMNCVLSLRNLSNMSCGGLVDFHFKSCTGNMKITGYGGNNRISKILMLIHESRSTINDGDFNWTAEDMPGDVHYTGTTVVYCDGHAKWVSQKSLIAANQKGEFNPDKAR
ncbi:MAG: DUF1559 domain-containing protein [Armatimonadota bacterium]